MTTSQQEADELLQQFQRERDRKRMEKLVSDCFAPPAGEYERTIDRVREEMRHG